MMAPEVSKNMLYVEVLFVLALVLLNGFFAMSELAVVSARKSRLKALAQSGSSRANGAGISIAAGCVYGT
jgi:CBS domain containing-hemolysin-like protein